MLSHRELRIATKGSDRYSTGYSLALLIFLRKSKYEDNPSLELFLAIAKYLIRVVRSCVATRWHGWTMSRGPGPKGAPREKRKKKWRKEKKNRKKEQRKGRKEKRERNFSNTWTRPPPDISHESNRWQKKYRSQTLVIITQSLKHEMNNGELGSYIGPIFFSACMTPNISQLKFGAHKFEKVQWSRIKPFEKNVLSRASSFPFRSSGVPISPSLRSLICPLRHQRVPNVPLRHQGPKFPFSVSGHLAATSVPIALLRVSNFPCIASSKGPKFSIASSRVPNFLIMSSKWWPLISHDVIKGSQFITASSRSPIVTSNFPSRYQRVAILIASSRSPHFPHRVIKETQIPKIHHVYDLWDIWHIFKKWLQ